MGDLLRAEHISRSFPGVLAVNDVSLTLREGEVLALIGENGAGKSTFSQVLCGVLRPDTGRIVIDDREVVLSSPHDAMEAGIGMVFQGLSLVGSLAVAENIFANRQPTGVLDNIRWKDLERMTADLLRKFKLDVKPVELVKRLSMGQQQMIEILKVISGNPKIVILDEPTSSLTEGEITYLFRIINQLRGLGISFIYISHKLSEIFEVADRVAVMRERQTDRCVRCGSGRRERPGIDDGGTKDRRSLRRIRAGCGTARLLRGARFLAQGILRERERRTAQGRNPGFRRARRCGTHGAGPRHRWHRPQGFW